MFGTPKRKVSFTITTERRSEKRLPWRHGRGVATTTVQQYDILCQ
jgi:hypothetical protein